MGVYIKDLEANLFLFQFYHEVDVKRVMDGCPWSFNRRALVMSRLKDGENPRCVELNSMDLWVQIYDLKAGFMTERIVQEIGNYVGNFVASAPTNFTGVWRDYLCVRVTIDITKPLKCKMKIRSAGGDWFWISFKYENVPTFCFIYGIVGHSENFCSKLFVLPASEIEKPYEEFMRAPYRRHVKPIGAKWLRNGTEVGDRSTSSGINQSRNDWSNQDPHFSPSNQGTVMSGGNFENTSFQNKQLSGNIEIRKDQGNNPIFPPIQIRKEVTVVESKKCKPDIVSDKDQIMGPDTEILMDSYEGNMEHPSSENVTSSKNGLEASTHKSARLVL